MTTRPSRSAKLAQRRDWWAQKTKNATGGEVAPSASTSGVQPTPNSQEEIVMTNHTPRPWLDDTTAKHLTEGDVAKLDADFARMTADNNTRPLGIDIVEYLRDCAADQDRVRRIMGPHDVPLPEFATVHKHSEWELSDDGTDCVRYLDAIYADVKNLNASLECDQYAVSTRMDLRVRIGEGITEDPAELANWALDLLALADRWKQIRKGLS